MNNIIRKPIPKPKGHHCFACGTANPVGLNLGFYAEGDFVCSEVVLDRNRVGWEGIAHGGIISTLLDEVMSWTIIFFRRVFFVTRRMEVKYLRPVPIGVPLTARGRMGSDLRPPSLVKVRGELLDDSGRVLARSTGEFAILSGDKLGMIPAELKEDMTGLFGRLEDLQAEGAEQA